LLHALPVANTHVRIDLVPGTEADPVFLLRLVGDDATIIATGPSSKQLAREALESGARSVEHTYNLEFER
jgi:hypothetical protein